MPESSAFSPEGARHISPGQGRRRQPPNAALGSLFVRKQALKGRHKRLLRKDFCPGNVTVVLPFQGFRFVPLHTQGGASLALGWYVAAPSGLKAADPSVG
jgi:hypothetical protein